MSGEDPTVDDEFQDVDDELGTLADVDTPIDAPDGSALQSLRARREKMLADTAHIDLEVTEYGEPTIFVRYRPVRQDALDQTYKRTANLRKDRTVITNAIILAEACIGIGQVVDGEEISIDTENPDAPWPRFDKRLAQLFGIPATKSTAVLREFYGRLDGLVISTAATLAEKSKFAQEQFERESGN